MSSAARSPRTGPPRSTTPAKSRPGHRDRAQRRASASGGARAPRPRGRRRARGVGDGAPPHVVAAVAGVAVGELAPARDALVAAGLLGPGGERFAHDLIALAISEELARTERERLHREAARALMAGGADADVVASHLLKCGPQADPEVSGLLLRAAAGAGQRGAPHTAAAYLERALAERAPGDDRGAHARAARRRSRSTPACRTRGAACARRCTRSTTARAVPTCSRAWPRSTPSTPATRGSRSCSSRSWRWRPIPTRGWRSRPRRWTR